MKLLIKPLSIYSIAYLVLLLCVLVLLFVYPKSELHMLLNAYHSDYEDFFFKYYSMMAEGPLYVLALLPLFWKKYGITAFFALSEVLGGTILQILKHTFCFERPVSLFEHYQGVTLPLVQGVDMHHGNSFPSGHASTFFVFFTCCAIIFAYYYMRRLQQNGHADHMKWFLINTVMLSMLVMAALGAYSRIYLSQHFLSDVCMGSIIGFATPCLVFCFCRKWLLKLNF